MSLEQVMSLAGDRERAGAALSAHGGGGEGIVIEEVRELALIAQVEEAQLRAWGMTPREVVPAAMLGIAAASGGILLGAYDDGRLVGFAFGLLARRDGRLYHASHMLATDPDYQGRGIGAALKREQRARALTQGLDLMTWTFDPLIARNAHLNLHKLGATSGAYYEDYYGPMEDRFNNGLPTDRLLVEWRLRTPTPTSPGSPRVPAGAAPLLILTDEAGAPVLHLDDPPTGAPLSVGVPADITHIKERDPAAALAWRMAVRQAFEWAFARGYVVRDFAGGAYLLLPGEAP